MKLSARLIVFWSILSLVACGDEHENGLDPKSVLIDGRSATEEGVDFEYITAPGELAENLTDIQDQIDNNFFLTEESDVFCPEGFSYRSDLKLCASENEAIGPFPEEMRQACRTFGGGNACENDNWSLYFTSSLRGSGDCPKGSYRQSDGLCTDGKNAYGPFPIAQVEKCEAKGGGNACYSLRWDLNFAISTLPERPGSNSLKGLRIAIDSGHGNAGECFCFDPGALNQFHRSTLTEYIYNLKTAKKVKEKLERLGATVKLAYYPRGSSSFPRLRNKGKVASGNDLFISIHHNSASRNTAQGSEVFTKRSASSRDKSLAKAIQTQLVRKVWDGARSKDRGVKAANFAIFGGVPSSVDARVLVEAWFINHRDLNPAKADILAAKSIDAIVQGVVDYHRK